METSVAHQAKKFNNTTSMFRQSWQRVTSRRRKAVHDTIEWLLAAAGGQRPVVDSPPSG
jgi:hypothetical protein